jgi:peptide/nickel transport system permease protein
MASNSAPIQLGTHSEDDYIKSESLLTKALRRLGKDYITLSAAGVLGVMLLLALLAPVITNAMGVDPNATAPMERMQGFGTPGHLLGTDGVGRDQLARLLHAGRVSLGIGFFGAVISLTVGLALGIITGYYGGVVDDVMNWIITTLDSIPGLYLLIMIAAVLKPTAESLVLVVAITGWTGVTRLIRGQTFQLRGLDYVTSAKAVGASPFRIMFAHIAPNLISVTVIVMMRSIGNLMLAEAGLSFLGFGVQPPQATWGNMLTGAQEFIRSNGGHLILAPGLCITIAVLCLYVIGDGVRDAFDPTSNK